MGRRGLARGTVGVERGQNGGDRGSDIVAQYDRHGCPEVEQAAVRKRDGQTDRSGAALHDHGCQGTDADRAQHLTEWHRVPRLRCAVKHLENMDETGEGADTLQFAGHHIHAKEEQAEAEQGARTALPGGTAREQ